MKRTQELERTADVLLSRSEPGTIGHRLGMMLSELLSPPDEHTMGAPETSPHLVDDNRHLRQQLEQMKKQLAQETEELNQHRELVARMRSEASKAKEEITGLKQLIENGAKERADLLERKNVMERRLKMAHEERNQYLERHDEIAKRLDEAHRKLGGIAPRLEPINQCSEAPVTASVEFKVEPGESASDMLQRLGTDGALWAKEFAATCCRVNKWHDYSTGRKIEELALGWFCSAIEQVKTWSPRNKHGDVIWRSGPGTERLNAWAKEGYFDHYSDAARMVMEYCNIPMHHYVAVQDIMEVFGDHQRGLVHGHYLEQSEAKADQGLDMYSAGIKDSAERLKNVLDREGLLPGDTHPEDHQ